MAKRILRLHQVDDDEPEEQEDDVPEDDWLGAIAFASDYGHLPEVQLRIAELRTLVIQLRDAGGDDHTSLPQELIAQPEKLVRTYEPLLYDGLKKLGWTDSQLREANAYITRPAPDEREMSRLTAEIGFKRADGSHFLEPADYEFKATLGIGGQGHAGLWVRRNENHLIVNRIVLKESWFATEEWVKEESIIWHGKYKDQYPREAYFHKKVSDCMQASDDPVIVPFLGWAIYDQKCLFRIAVGYCGHSDLHEIRDTHFDRKGGTTDCVALEYPYYHMATPALWRIFQVLARAVSVTAYGSYPGQQEPKEEWRTILHRDMKPANVFLGAVHDFQGQTMPMPQVGDFGLACYADEDLARWDEFGTQGYAADEQYTQGRRGPTAAADVYGVGRTMQALMDLILDYDMENAAKELSRESLQVYPYQLTDLVDKCISLRPDRRPDARVLCNDIDNEIANLANRIVGDDENDVREKLFNHSFDFPPDQYKLLSI